MTQRAEPERKRLNTEITSVADVQGNHGPQWKVEYKFPGSQFPAKGWIDANGVRPVPGPAALLLEKGILLKDKDGSAEWHYRWRIIEIGAFRPDTATDPLANQERPGESRPRVSTFGEVTESDREKRRSIEQQQALLLAVQLYTAQHSTKPPDLPLILDTAEVLYAWLHQRLLLLCMAALSQD